MLFLHQNDHWNELYKCGISGELIGPGDFYYKDSEDGLIVKATVYKEIKEKEKRQQWNYEEINRATSEAEYKKRLKDATRLLLSGSVLDRKIAGKYDPTPESEILQEIYSSQKRGDNE